MVSATDPQLSTIIMDIKIWIILALLVGGIVYARKGKAQFIKTASCSDAAFDRKVNSYLSYSVPVIGVKEAFSNKSSYHFLDAREKHEFSVSHIEGAQHIGYDYFSIENVRNLKKETPIIVYCSIGYRSEKIGTKLRKAGYQKVYNLYGSIFEWVNQGYPVVSSTGTVKKVHTYNKKWSQWVKNPSVIKVY